MTNTNAAAFTVSYVEPTYGTRTFRVNSAAELAKAKAWLDAGGYSYRVRAA